MSGLVKAKEHDWLDSNMALFGSDTEKSVKKESAQQEIAWKHAGEKVGLQIWRIEKFKVVAWPKENYGQFFTGDSYIILNTYKEQDSDQLLYDVHFWIGTKSTQDEYGTAAYKTVELDTLLDDVPVQHREVQNYESSLFKSYFSVIQYLEGGAETGFNHVEPEKYTSRLLHVSGNKKGVTVEQIPMQIKRITSSDVFILDKGLKIYQFNGKDSNKDEKFSAVRHLQTIKSERRGKAEVDTLDDIGQFCDLFDHEDDGNDDEVDAKVDEGPKSPSLHRLSDASGELEFVHCKDGKAYKSDFDSKDVFLYDTISELFVWIGKKASKAETANGLTYGHNYLNNTNHKLSAITVVKEGKESKFFRMAISA